MTVKYEKTKSHQRYKLKDGTIVPGASTVCKLGDDPSNLLKWAWQQGCDGLDFMKTRDNAADIGTLFHFRAECFLAGNDPDLSEFSEADRHKSEIAFVEFRKFWEQERLTLVETETQLVSEAYRYGGTLDLVAKDSLGDLVLCDWKTSRGIYDSFLYQLSAYEQLWNLNREQQIARRAIIRVGKEHEGDTETRWLSNMDRYFHVFKAQLALYYAKKAAK